MGFRWHNSLFPLPLHLSPSLRDDLRRVTQSFFKLSHIMHCRMAYCSWAGDPRAKPPGWGDGKAHAPFPLPNISCCVVLYFSFQKALWKVTITATKASKAKSFQKWNSSHSQHEIAFVNFWMHSRSMNYPWVGLIPTWMEDRWMELWNGCLDACIRKY